jgi:hypothetical protein
MAKVLYFNGETELKNVTDMPNAEFAKRFPGVKGRRSDGYSMWVGRPDHLTERFIPGEGWDRSDLLPVERVVSYKSNPSKHVCDARCMNATGRTMNCECSCGGKNHGRAAFNCAEVAA